MTDHKWEVQMKCVGLKCRQRILISYINLDLMEVLAYKGGTYMNETNVLNGGCGQKQN